MEQSDINAAKNRTDALAIVAFAAASLFVTTGGYLFNQHSSRLTELEHAITDIQLDDTIRGQQLMAHIDHATHWIDIIKESRKNCTDVIRRLDRLETKPSARPDAFTSKDGDRLEDMIMEIRKHIPNLNKRYE